MADMELDPLLAQPLQPGPQQRGCLHVTRKDAPGGADEGLDSQPLSPIAQGIRTKLRQQRRHEVSGRAITLDKVGIGLGVGEVHAAFAGLQKLATHRWHGIKQRHRMSPLS